MVTDMNPLYTHALPFIDVVPPYYALQDLHLLPTHPSTKYPIVSGSFRREQLPPAQSASSFCGSEFGRHTAILGSVAAAYSNPVKAKHYYLALDATADFVCVTSEELRAEARIVSAAWEKKRVNCEIEAFTLQGQFAGRLRVSYAILTEPQLLEIVKPVDPKLVLGTPWQPGEPSPYENPIMLRMERTHSCNLASAIISLHNVRSMAGHFSPRATAPIAILSSNAIALCRRLMGEKEGKLWLDRRARVRCQRLAVAGEILELRAIKINGVEHSYRVDFLDEQGRLVGNIEYLVKEIDVGEDGEKAVPKL